MTGPAVSAVVATRPGRWRHTALLPLRLGGAGQDGRDSRTVRARGTGPQQQGDSARVCQEGGHHRAIAGRITKAWQLLHRNSLRLNIITTTPTYEITGPDLRVKGLANFPHLFSRLTNHWK